MEDGELWVEFAKAAIQNYEIPDDIEDAAELADDMSEVCAQIADSMLEEYKGRFAGGERAAPRARRSRKRERETESEKD